MDVLIKALLLVLYPCVIDGLCQPRAASAFREYQHAVLLHCRDVFLLGALHAAQHEVTVREVVGLVDAVRLETVVCVYLADHQFEVALAFGVVVVRRDRHLSEHVILLLDLTQSARVVLVLRNVEP